MSTKSHISACLLDCPDACSFVVGLDDEGNVASLRGNPDHPFTEGFICAKTGKFPDRMNHPERITTPLMRKGGDFVPVTWDKALGAVAERIDALRGTPERILHIRGWGLRGVLGNASTFLFGNLGASAVGGSLCDEAGIEASVEDFGALDHNDPHDLLNAARIVNWGRDVTRCSVHQLALFKKARKAGTRILSISPGGDGTAEFSDAVIRIRPGCDRFLAAALAKALIDHGVPEATTSRIGNYAAYKARLDLFSIPDMLLACGVGAEDFSELLSWYLAEGGTTATVIGWGLQRYLHGGENVRHINALAVLSGNVGRSGGGVYFNISSGRNFADWASRGAKPGRRMFPLHDLGRTLLDADPPVELLWIDGMNPANQVPDAKTAAEAIERCPFTVVVEAFMTDTARRADLILPCALMTEREDITGSCLHSYVNWSARVCDPPGEARPDFEFVSELGRKLREPVRLPPAEDCLAAALSGKATPFSMAELREKGFMRGQWPIIAFEDMQFGYPDGKCRLAESLHPELLPDPQWPCRLLTLVNRDFIHSQRPPDEIEGPPTVFVSPSNPCLESLDREAPVYLASPLGRMRVLVSEDPTLHCEAVVGRRGGWMALGKGFNVLVEPMECDWGGGTAYYSQRVRLEN